MLRSIVFAAIIFAAAAFGLAPASSVAAEPAASAADDFDFLFRLGMLEGHLLVGHELLVAKQVALALPHYGHPVKELYDDIGPYLTAKKFPPFDKDLIALEAAVTTAPDAPATEAKYQAVLATVHKARELAPAQMRASLPEMIKVCASTIDAASGEYSKSIEHDKIASVVDYHDSRGFLEYVAQEVTELKTAHPDAQSQAVITRFAAVLAKAQAIVGELVPAPTPRASVADYRAVAAEATSIGKQ